jgi:lactoylglutathione lyase
LTLRDNIEEDVLKIGDSDVAMLLLTPIEPAVKPQVQMHPLYHIGLWVDDLFNCVKWLESQGVRMAPGGIRRGLQGHDIAFVHPKSSGGVLLELSQHPSGSN